MGKQSIKVVSIVGARPQFIKAATVSRVIQSYDGITEVLVHTGQHYDDNMSAIFFSELELPIPEFNLAIGSGLHGFQTGRMLEGIERILVDEKPDFVIVYGDTNSTLAGALAASKLNIPIAHVEAGLRSYNSIMPEEINRKVTDQISDILFTPCAKATTNLEWEGVDSSKIFQVGDVMYDAVLFYENKANEKKNILSRLGVEPKKYCLVTCHRSENTKSADHLKRIFQNIKQLSKKVKVVFPMHPRTNAIVEEYDLWDFVGKNVNIIEPLSYLEMAVLGKNAEVIVSDSGGIQKEAYFYNVPCLVLRDETEWVELLDMNANHLVGSDGRYLIEKYMHIIKSESIKWKKHVYGEGNSAKLIVMNLLRM